MHAIFFDLETSDRNPIGQILNFAFTLVDQNLDEIRTFAADIKVSRLELPQPGAILTNRINLLEHQRSATLSEVEAAHQIWEFISSAAEQSGGKIALVGYNSSRFDVPFLRTTLIRNGLNPYFQQKIIYKDLLSLSRKLSCTNADFPRKPASGGEANRLSLSLETLAREFNLLKGAQSHQSEADVRLTIELAKIYRDQFRMNILDFESYEIKAHKKGETIIALEPNYDLASTELAREVQLALVDFNHRSALWVDLHEHVSGDRARATRWFTLNSHPLFVKERSVTNKHTSLTLEGFKGVTVSNFFPMSVCDIEQDIYRLDFTAIDALHQAIWKKDRAHIEKLNSAEAKEVWRRFRIANYRWGGARDEEAAAALKTYALYRYGGRCILSKTKPAKPEDYQSSLKSLINEVDQRISEGSTEDVELLQALRSFYLQSDIYSVAGAVLMSDIEQAA